MQFLFAVLGDIRDIGCREYRHTGPNDLQSDASSSVESDLPADGNVPSRILAIGGLEPGHVQFGNCGLVGRDAVEFEGYEIGLFRRIIDLPKEAEEVMRLTVFNRDPGAIPNREASLPIAWKCQL